MALNKNNMKIVRKNQSAVTPKKRVMAVKVTKVKK